MELETKGRPIFARAGPPTMDAWCYEGNAGGRPASDATGSWVRPNAALLAGLTQRVQDAVLPHFDAKPILYADIPIHLNVGDLLINLAAETLFVDHGIEVQDRVSLDNPQRLFRGRQGRDGTVVLHGGGNFGDLYPRHETFRQRVLESFPDRAVVLLPQTVHYQDRGRLRHDMRRWSGHRKLVFMVRDEPSLELVRPFLGERAVLVPDLVHYLRCRPAWLTPTRPARSTAQLMMARRDIECPGPCRSRLNTHVFDWDDLCGPAEFGHFALAARLIRFDNAVALPFDPIWAWYPGRNRLIRKAVAHFGAASAVMTNRLHGMLLALMMGVPVQVRDNSYGKLTSYITSWSLAADR